MLIPNSPCAILGAPTSFLSAAKNLPPNTRPPPSPANTPTSSCRGNPVPTVGRGGGYARHVQPPSFGRRHPTFITHANPQPPIVGCVPCGRPPGRTGDAATPVNLPRSHTPARRPIPCRGWFQTSPRVRRGAHRRLRTGSSNPTITTLRIPASTGNTARGN